MREFFNKYDLRMLMIEECHFHDRDLTLLYNRKQSYDITKMYGTKIQYMLLS
jgi:hypothetical protein